MTDANLLVTFDPSHAGSAEKEVKAILAEEKETPKFLKSDVGGVFLLKTKKDPKAIVKKLKGICKKDSSKFEYTYNWIPVDKWYDAKMPAMQKAVAAFDKKIKNEEKWKMELNKRMFDGNTMDLILKLTEKINKPNVNLKNPDKIVKVEIVKKKAGISLLKPDEILNVPSFKE